MISIIMCSHFITAYLSTCNFINHDDTVTLRRLIIKNFKGHIEYPCTLGYNLNYMADQCPVRCTNHWLQTYTKTATIACKLYKQIDVNICTYMLQHDDWDKKWPNFLLYHNWAEVNFIWLCTIQDCNSQTGLLSLYAACRSTTAHSEQTSYVAQVNSDKKKLCPK